MVVLLALIVVEVELRDARLEEFEGFVDAYVFFRVRDVSVTEIETNPDAIEVADAEDFEDVFGRGDLVAQIFNEDADAEGMGKGLEVLDGSEGVFEGAGVPGVIFVAEMENAGGDGDLFGGLERALDLIHGGDAMGFFGVDEINCQGDVTGPLSAAAVGEEEG